MAVAGQESIPELLLSVLDKIGEFETSKLAEELSLDHNKIIGAVKSLLSHENVSFYSVFLFFD